MNQFMHSLLTSLMDLLEPIGIIAGLVFSGTALRNDVRSRRIENRIKLTEGYREIWSVLLSDPSLGRIRRNDVDLIQFPVTPGEDRLGRFVFQNILLAYDARKAGQLGDIGDFEKDVAEFISRPIPQAVWKEIARFQPEDFRRFVERQM
jgi:hypothetical protein